MKIKLYNDSRAPVSEVCTFSYLTNIILRITRRRSQRLSDCLVLQYENNILLTYHERWLLFHRVHLRKNDNGVDSLSSAHFSKFPNRHCMQPQYTCTLIIFNADSTKYKCCLKLISRLLTLFFKIWTVTFFSFELLHTLSVEHWTGSCKMQIINLCSNLQIVNTFFFISLVKFRLVHRYTVVRR